MDQEFDAIYELGVFRPLERVDLVEQTKVHIRIHEAAEGSLAFATDEGSKQRAELRELLGWVHGRPVVCEERFSARDHDRILYGSQK